ncbi:hypothetical protein EAS64_13875 [Trebonia kvetii]|uniref:Uncharacterized protein n=1 Tax=Trebonia kvetii TaxID=2480626 RepID=A0A6P2C3S5_9ACTN|nr:hypothetical protein [Trebonia kvetii]TVZ05597.1 hypothetical protein EAS64_13875 [Trebonia kvetii]
MTAGALNGLHCDAIALGRHRADAAHARVGDRVAVTLGDGTQTRATVVAVYTRDVAGRLRALVQRYPGLQLSDSASLVTANAVNDELNNWLGPFFVAMIFTFTSIAVLNTLIMIALRRRRELALLRLTGAIFSRLIFSR